MAIVRLAVAASLFNVMQDAEATYNSIFDLTDTYVDFTEDSFGYILDQIDGDDSPQIFPDNLIFAAQNQMGDYQP
jgi:hypothetical protein